MSEVFLAGVVDIFGDPVAASRGKKGRPPHVPTAENRRFVQLALVCGHDQAAIAAGLRITERTLNRHYFHELAGRQSARLRLEMKNMAAIVGQVEAGKVGAMSLLDKKMERLRQREVAAKHQTRAPDAVTTPLGKKAARRAAASEVEGRYAPPAGPAQMH